MTILLVRPKRLEEGNQSANFNNRGNSHVKTFHVMSDDLDDFPDAIVAAADPVEPFAIPAIGEKDPANARRVVRNQTPIPRGGNEDDGYAFDVEVEYNTTSDFAGVSASDFSYEPDPTLRIAEVQWSFLKEPVVAKFARAIWNGTGWTAGAWTTIPRPGGGPPLNVYTGVPILNS
ncbi:MAG TPA: hypothetical protein P5572_20265, partial [Phycisphaerae bacterium]|nr:hypothetical protein [Phycisphaerae bacterium]